MIRKDLTGMKFHKLTVLQVCSEKVGRRFVWECLCDCGGKALVRSDALKSGTVKSCGCLVTAIKEDLTGQKFQQLTVIGRSSERYKGFILWDCLCDCGNTISAMSYTLKKGYPKSCGCIPRKNLRKDLTGKKFGRLTVSEECTGEHKRTRWNCLCDCGNTTSVTTTSLTSGKTKSCGCLRTDREDLVGRTFGRLMVIIENIEQTRLRKRGPVWDCVCVCGNKSVVRGDLLKVGSIRSCGCLQRDKAYEAGKLTGYKNLQGHEQDRVDGVIVCSLTRGMLRNNTSGHKGVSWSASKGKWRAYITLRDKQLFLGYYDDVQEAAKARQEAEKEHFKPIVDKYEKMGGKQKKSQEATNELS